jgi:integrase
MWVEKNGKTHRIRDLVNGQKVTLAKGYATKTAANEAMVLLRADELRGEALVPRGGEMTLDAWLDEWLPGYEVSIRTASARSELSRIEYHIRPLLGHVPIGDIDHLTVQRWVLDILRGRGRVPAGKRGRRPLQPKTVRNCHGLLYGIMQAAVHAKLIRGNPCLETKLPEVEPHEMRFLTEPEAVRLLAATPAHWRPLVLLLLSTGLRWSEAIGLRPKNVDLLARPPRVTVVEQLQELPGSGEMVFGPPKTRESRRTVTLAGKVTTALAGLVLVDRNATIFTAPKGGYVRTRNFRRTWLVACKRAGLEGLRIHDLRHTHAAWLISDGKPLTGIQRRLGHSSIAITSDLYGHLLPSVDEGILATIDEALAGVDLDAMAAEIADELVDELAAA